MAPRSLRRTPRSGTEVLSVAITTTHLKSIILRTGMNLTECSRRLPISKSQFDRILAGAIPRLDVAVAFATVLDKPIADIWPATPKTRLIR
jgi:hypothetical protein